MIPEGFLKETDKTGRFLIRSIRTGKLYACEPLHTKERRRWGYIQQFSDGAIQKEESLITEENGFKNIETLKPGESPLEWIKRIDSTYPTI